jgi:hypothetical protein
MRGNVSVLPLAARREEPDPQLLVSLGEWRRRLGESWCRVMHDEITWPIHGHYRCRRCHRLYPVPWEEPARRQRRRTVEIQPAQTPGAALHRLAA